MAEGEFKAGERAGTTRTKLDYLETTLGEVDDRSRRIELAVVQIQASIIDRPTLDARIGGLSDRIGKIEQLAQYGRGIYFVIAIVVSAVWSAAVAALVAWVKK